MQCLITTLTRSHSLNQTTGEKMKYKTGKNNNSFTAKVQHLNLKALSNNVKTQSEETLITQIYFFTKK